MQLKRQSETLPVKGIVESELYICMHTDKSFSPNAKISISVGEPYNMTFADHFISRIDRKGSRLTIRAYDRIRMTENIFLDSSFKRENEPFMAIQVISQIAEQCGFSGIGGMNPVPTWLYYDDIHEKTCREILDMISRNSVGAWFCANNNNLCFEPFLSDTRYFGMYEDKSAPVYLQSEKGPFDSVYAVNTATGEIFNSGAAQHFNGILKVKGNIFSKELADSLMDRVRGIGFKAFSCSHMAIYSAIDGIAGFRFSVYPDKTLFACRSVIHFTGSEVYAEAMSPDICEDESDYIDVTGYELRKRIIEGRKYGNTVITDKGVGFVKQYGTDMREADISYFSTASDGITTYDGVMNDGVMPSKIIKSGDNERTVMYGDTKYRLTWDKAEDGSKTNIRYEKAVE